MAQSNEETVVLLNADLYGEHDAILYYVTHAWTVVRQHGQQILEIANDEMRHFKWLGHAISQLGGIPDLTPPSIGPVSTAQSALQTDVDAEIHAIHQYQEHTELIEDARIKQLLQRIIVDERDHLRQFQELLDSTHGEPGFSRPPEDDMAPLAQKLQQTMQAEYQQMIAYLLRSFTEDHTRQLGLDMEERSIDEMRHMGWIGRRLGAIGVQADLSAHEIQTLAAGEQDEWARYQDMRIWAKEHLPALLPTIDRFLAHETYHLQS
ncbi:MAG: rubrerythrin [Firmicutes bacterium]|jgi:bacterioferritin|nr:rubrerythrin [Bacillota bacterium]